MNRVSIDALRSFSGVGAIEPRAATTALLLIDMQNAYVRPDGFTLRRLLDRGLESAAREYASQLETAVPNLVRLLASARRHGQPVFHVRTVNLPGRQSGGLVRPNQLIAASSAGAEVIAELAPAEGEFVITKHCSGVFAGTNIDLLLRRLGVTALIVGGVVTDGCVEQAVRQAHDLTYACVMVSDGCAALTREIHENALERLEHRRAHVLDAASLLAGDTIHETTVRLGAREAGPASA